MPLLVVGVMNFAFKSEGWQEAHYFPEGVTRAQAAEKMKQIIWGRSALFGSGVTITYARTSVIGPGPDKDTVNMPYPIGPHPTWQGGTGAGDTLGPPNEGKTSLFQCFQAAGGKWGNRHFRGSPDAWITNKLIQPGIFDYLQPAPDTGSSPNMAPGGPLGSHLAVCKAFWRYLIRETVLTHKVSAINYTPSAYIDIVFRGVSSKKTGRPFGVSAGRRPAVEVS